MLRWIVAALAVAGLVLGAFTVIRGQKQPPEPPLAAPPSVNPFAHGIAAAGMVEASSRNIAVAAPEAGLVMEVLVQVGQKVAKDDPLFQLDRRQLESDLLRARAAMEVANAELAKSEARPRMEEGPPLQARIDSAQARLADADQRYKDILDAQEKGGATPTEISQRRFALDEARAELERSQAEWNLWDAGTWAQDVLIAHANVTGADAQIKSIEVLLERLTVRSPIEGTVLKRNIEPGQFAAGVPGEGAVVVGDLTTLHVRARVDEEDAPLLGTPIGRAVAKVRGASNAMLPLRLVRIEPLAIPKRDLTGENTERVDTRVVEVIFAVEVAAEGTNRPTIYPGQMVDVFIETPGVPAATGAADASDEEFTKEK
ncbi:MAG: HlyD family efflux transporter periplasmic adaptor subunit [Phycisphaerales bacterium]|nr:HlyD family efflux transporter periplasmic adaptor subunit [Phycisphaerales bacterium]